MYRKTLNKLIIVLLLSFIFGTFFSLILVKVREKTPDDPRETVEFFKKLLEEGDKALMENFVMPEPLLYRKQMSDQRQANYQKYLASKTTEHVVENDDSTGLKEAPLREPQEIPRHFVNQTELLDKVAGDILFSGDFLIKEVGEVTEKDNQAIVAVKLAKRTDKTGGSVPTQFWLYKETDGRWRIFLISNFEFNRQWAH